jgi:hypothetical protein
MPAQYQAELAEITPKIRGLLIVLGRESGLNRETEIMLQKMLEGKPIFTAGISEHYNDNPSEACWDVWNKLGPNGIYKRQMVEGVK